MNKEEHPYISLIKSDNPKLIGIGYRMILDIIRTSAMLGLFRSHDNKNNKTFIFTDTSDIPNNCETVYEWDFGDGSPKIFSKNATYEFKSGTYIIKHRVTNKLGTDFYEQELKVD